MISREEWERLEPLLDAVLDAPLAERGALIVRLTGGDPTLRTELERLLGELGPGHGLLARPATERFAALLEATTPFPASLADRYRVEGELGRGGMATVYLARDLKHGRDVAVKVVHPLLVASAGRERFLREIAIVARLRHPHIVPLFDSGEADGTLFYVMPYEEGHSLRERLARAGPLPVGEAVLVLREVCDALAHAHAHGIVHRDIKPDNVLLSGGHATVTDFGVATAVSDGAEAAGETSRGGVIGTPAYMAPEQVAGDPAVDHRADLYAFGCLAYELLTGSPPFEGTTRAEVLEAHLNTRPRALESARPEVPAALATLVMRCLEKRAEDRWQRAGDVQDALSRATAGTGAPTWRRVVAPLGAVAIVVAGVVAVIMSRAPGRVPEARSLTGVSTPPLVLGLLPIRATGPDDRVSSSLEGLLSAELSTVSGFTIRPSETIAAAVARRLPLDRVALESDVDYLVRLTLLDLPDSLSVSIELVEHGLFSMPAGRVRIPRRPVAPVDVAAARAADSIRAMLGARIREREHELGTAVPVALLARRRADHHRAVSRRRFRDGDLRGSVEALDSAAASLRQSERADSTWAAPRLARAALSRSRGSAVLIESGGADAAGVRRVYDAGIALVDSVVDLFGPSAPALALRGRLRWEGQVLGGAQPSPRATDSAARDLEAAIALDSTMAAAAADLSQLRFVASRFAEAATLAERAYRLDAYMEESSQIINRLAQSRLEIGEDSAAAFWCREGVRRFPANPAHRACSIEVMAWSSAPVVADSVWARYDEVIERVSRANVGAAASYLAMVAAALTRAHGLAPDSVRRVLARAKSLLEAGRGSPPARDELLVVEAAVLYRLGDRARAGAILDQVRARDPERLDRALRRRMLRGLSPAPVG